MDGRRQGGEEREREPSRAAYQRLLSAMSGSLTGLRELDDPYAKMGTSRAEREGSGRPISSPAPSSIPRIRSPAPSSTPRIRSPSPSRSYNMWPEPKVGGDALARVKALASSAGLSQTNPGFRSNVSRLRLRFAEPMYDGSSSSASPSPVPSPSSSSSASSASRSTTPDLSEAGSESTGSEHKNESGGSANESNGSANESNGSASESEGGIDGEQSGDRACS